MCQISNRNARYAINQSWRPKTATPKQVRASLQAYVEYWEGRLEMGDLLLDQWMWDAYEAAKDAVAAVDRIGAAAGIDLT